MNVTKYILRIIKIALTLYVLYWVVIFLVLIYNSFTEPYEYLASDYRIFKDTPAWDLAKAVRDADTAEISHQILEKKIPIDFQDSIYGKSILSLAVYQDNINSVKKLLELGADPNLYEDTINQLGTNPVIDACFFNEEISIEILKLLLDYGGNPSSVTKGVNDGHPYRMSAMEVSATFGDTEKIKVLMNYGANINFVPNRDYDSDPLHEALYTHKMGTALYLLENGAKFDKEYLNPFTKNKENILYILRKIDLPLNSEEYKYKLKIINLLKTKGLDYYNEPIPDFMVKKIKRLYPNSWEVYIKKY